MHVSLGRTVVALRRLSLVLVAGCLAACGGSSSSAQTGTGAGAPPANIAPLFGCVKAVFTAGGPRILVCWGEAQDDLDPPAFVSYRIYLAAASGAHDFNAPAAIAAAGTTCLQLTNLNSPLIAVGAEVFVVVRPVDSAGLEGENTVECACTPVATSDVAFVQAGAAGPGTLGDPSDPFPSLQGGIEAVPGSGGAVVVAGGVYNEFAAAVSAGDAGSTLGIYGSFDGADFTAGATAQTLLAGVDPDGNPSEVDGNGLDPVNAPIGGQVGHFDVRNEHRRTYVGGFLFHDNERQVLLGALRVDLVVFCCSFTDTQPGELDAPDETPRSGISVGSVDPPQLQSVPVDSNRIAIIGCFFDEIRDDGSGNELPEGVTLAGRLERLVVGGNRAEDCNGFVIGDVMITGGIDFAVDFQCNDVTRMNFPFNGNNNDFNANALYLRAIPEGAGQAGSFDLQVRYNRIAGCDRGVEVDRFGEHGNAAGSHTVVSHSNFFGAVDSSAVRCRPLSDNNMGPDDNNQFVTAGTIDLTSRWNLYGQLNSEAFFFFDLALRDNATLTVLLEDDASIQDDSEMYEFFSTFPDAESATYSQDGAQQTFTLRRATAFSTDGLIRVSMPVYRGGRTIFHATDNVADGMTDEPFDLNFDRLGTNVTALGDAALEEDVTISNNFGTAADESSNEFLRLRLEVRSPMGKVVASLNEARRCEEFADVDLQYRNAPGVATHFYSEGNLVRSGDDSGVIDLSFVGQGPGEAFVRICNNDFHSGRENVDINGFDDIDNTFGPDVRGYCFVGYNILKGPTEGDGFEFNVDSGVWNLLVARNLFFGGGDDNEPAIDISVNGGGSAGLDAWVRNNLAAFVGDGIGTDSSGMPIAQLVNNTVAFCGQGPFDMVLGTRRNLTVFSDPDFTVFRELGPDSPMYVHNCISHGNNAHDVNPSTIATYTILEEPASSAGMGSILGNPLFRLTGDATDPVTFLALRSDSPTFDAGDPDPAHNDPNGTRNDMGAFGGPGAGPLGILATFETPCPFLVIGTDPLVNLHAGVNFPTDATPITVVFTQEVNGNTVNSNSLGFEVGGAPVAGAYVTDGKRVTFTPAAAWPPGANVRIVARTTLISTLGTPLDFQHQRWFAVAPANTTVEAEANNTTATANGLPNDDVVRATGDLANPDDSDFFSYDLTAGDRLQASLVGHRLAQMAGSPPPVPGEVDFRLQLIAPDGVTVLFDNDAALPQGDPFIDFTVSETGTHFIRVFDTNGGIVGGPFSYQLNIWRR